jgi:hypothetical protein
MTSHSKFRGHPIVWHLGKWVYADDLSDLPATGGDVRPCLRCGAVWPLEKGDPCLGILPGVDNACCGHGNRDESYIRFTSGVVVKGFEIEHINERKGRGK